MASTMKLNGFQHEGLTQQRRKNDTRANSIARGIGVLLFLLVNLFFSQAGIVYGMDEKIPGASAQLMNPIEKPVSYEDDIRVQKLEVYLSQLSSPLVDNSEDFVRYADTYGLEENWSIIAAIAGVESTFGKRVPSDSYNAWGWGIPTGKQSGIGFNNWENGIATVTKGVKENYIDRGSETLPEIGRIYAPPSNTWANNVAFFMNKIEQTPAKPVLEL